MHQNQYAPIGVVIVLVLIAAAGGNALRPAPSPGTPPAAPRTDTRYIGAIFFRPKISNEAEFSCVGRDVSQCLRG